MLAALVAEACGCGRIGYNRIGAGATGGTGGGAGGSGGADPAAGGAGGSGGADAGALDADAGGSLRIQYFPAMQDRVSDDWLRPHFDIVNGTSQDVPLAELAIRYWYTEEAPAAQTMACDFAFVLCPNVTATFSAVTPPRTGADQVMEIGFLAGAGTLVGGGQTQEIGLRVSKSDFSAYDESNDYSYDGSLTQLTDDTRIGLYRNGVLIWGIEPP